MNEAPASFREKCVRLTELEASSYTERRRADGVTHKSPLRMFCYNCRCGSCMYAQDAENAQASEILRVIRECTCDEEDDRLRCIVLAEARRLSRIHGAKQTPCDACACYFCLQTRINARIAEGREVTLYAIDLNKK